MLNKNKGVYAPTYYKKFKCIAERCKHSCCIDWEICIDENTFSKYKEIESISRTIIQCEDGPCFKLTGSGRCPHLNDSGLCDIILNHGEDYLSNICKNHPRFFNNIGNRRIEAGYGIVCEEACRLILEDEEPFSLYKIDEITDDIEDSQIDFDSLPEREKIFPIIESNNYSYNEKVTVLKKEYEIPELYTFNEWLEIYLKLERLDSSWENILKFAKGKTISEDNIRYDVFYTRLLKYFVYRYLSIADCFNNLRARLAFSILSVNIIRLIFENQSELTLEKLIDISRRYSAEIEYSEENTEDLIWEFESELL